MRQRNAIGGVTVVLDRECLPNRVDQRTLTEKLSDREFADRQHQLGFEQLELASQPAGAALDFVRGGHTISALRALARKATAHRGEIDPIAGFVLGPAERRIEPFEKRFAGRPREGTAEHRLLIAWRLSDQQHATRDWPADHAREFENAMRSDTTSTATADRGGSKPGGGRGTHVVSQGESLWQIAREYSTSVTRLQQLNDLSQGQAIQPGQVLKLDDID